jgi:hypothetical protein
VRDLLTPPDGPVVGAADRCAMCGQAWRYPWTHRECVGTLQARVTALEGALREIRNGWTGDSTPMLRQVIDDALAPGAREGRRDVPVFV